jgi:hypothetical protein
MRNAVFALAVIVGLAFATRAEAQVRSPRGVARRGARSTGSKTAGFPKAGAAISSQTIRAGRPGWYVPNLGPIDLNTAVRQARPRP